MSASSRLEEVSKKELPHLNLENKRLTVKLQLTGLYIQAIDIITSDDYTHHAPWFDQSHKQLEEIHGAAKRALAGAKTESDMTSIFTPIQEFIQKKEAHVTQELQKAIKRRQNTGLGLIGNLFTIEGLETKNTKRKQELHAICQTVVNREGLQKIEEHNRALEALIEPAKKQAAIDHAKYKQECLELITKLEKQGVSRNTCKIEKDTLDLSVQYDTRHNSAAGTRERWEYLRTTLARHMIELAIQKARELIKELPTKQMQEAAESLLESAKARQPEETDNYADFYENKLQGLHHLIYCLEYRTTEPEIKRDDKLTDALEKAVSVEGSPRIAEETTKEELQKVIRKAEELRNKSQVTSVTEIINNTINGIIGNTALMDVEKIQKLKAYCDQIRPAIEPVKPSESKRKQGTATESATLVKEQAGLLSKSRDTLLPGTKKNPSEESELELQEYPNNTARLKSNG